MIILHFHVIQIYMKVNGLITTNTKIQLIRL